MDVGQPVHGARTVQVGGWAGVVPTHPARGEEGPEEVQGAQRPGPGSAGVGPGVGPGGRARGRQYGNGGGDGSWVPPFGPGQPTRGPPCTQDPWNAASWPIGARLGSYFSKVSQNRQVSPKLVNKASHTPYFQNGSQKSPLEILRFPISPAFSHKELMGQFWPYLGHYCQNDEVSPMCTCTVDGVGSQICASA